MFLLFSCESNTNQEVDLDEVTKGSERNYTTVLPNSDVLTKLNLSLFSRCFISKLKLNDTLTIIDSAKSEFLQRFHPIQSEHWKNEEEKKMDKLLSLEV